MWVKGTCCTSPLIVLTRRTSYQQRSSRGWPCRQHHTHNPTPLDGSAKESISVSANSDDYCTTSSPSKMRYYVMLLLSKFVMLFWANLIYGNAMLYMSLGLVVLLLLWTRNCTGYPRQSHLVLFPWSMPSNAEISSLRRGSLSSSSFALRISERSQPHPGSSAVDLST
jgi:hypothetical protein